MYTLGYSFKPWPKAKAIADGPSILKYIQETASENGIDKHIRYSLLVKKATWSSDRAVWTVETECKKTAETLLFSCNFLLMCSGYYSYKEGYTPNFKGMESFKGEIVHPQDWPENLNYRDKKVVVIGSGATAITLVPEMAKDARHVVMLQRSPTYVVSNPESDVLANFLNKFMPEKLAYAIIRWKYITRQQLFYRITRTKPEKVKQKLLELVRKELGDDYDVETHFTPRYNPWDQRLCLAPNSDFFEAIKSGNASVITDIIETFTEKGILLKSGKELEVDLIVTATGLNLIILGGVQFSVDNQAIEFPKTYTYKGMMYSDVPNLVSVFGYINASWTLRAELVAEYVCRLINYMDEMGFHQCTPRLRDRDGNMQARSLIKDFSSGYMQRVMHLFPKQGDCEPWIYPQNYQRDKKMIRHGALEDGVLIFSHKET